MTVIDTDAAAGGSARVDRADEGGGGTSDTAGVGRRRGEGDDGRGGWDDGCRVMPTRSTRMGGGGLWLSDIDADAAAGGSATDEEGRPHR